MKCPRCKEGNLFLYKVTEKVYHINLTKKNTFSKRNRQFQEHDTEMDYLECDNNNCVGRFEYKIKENGVIIIIDDLTDFI